MDQSVLENDKAAEENRLELERKLPRYLRIVYSNRRRWLLDQELEIAKEKAEIIGMYLERLEWFPSFLAFPGEMNLNSLADKVGINYRQQGLFPMDVSSALAVLALKISSTEPVKVLDLCCSPGAKFLMISENVSSNSLLVGVDISERRLQTCRALLEQWQLAFAEEPEIPQQYLFHCDGTHFGKDQFGSLVFASEILKKENETLKNRKRKNKSLRKRLSDGLQRLERQLLEQQKVLSDQNKETPVVREGGNIPSLSQFDYILVDAECTHDASYRHMKYVEDGSKWVKKPPSSAAIQKLGGGSAKKRGSNRLEGYFLVNEENSDDDQADFWDNEYTIEDVDKFIQAAEINRVDSETKTGNAILNVQNNQSVVPPDPAVVSKSISLSHNIRDVKISSEGKINLLQLQRSLLENAFRLLKPGGVIVYSTCSQEEEQNEEVVHWLLSRYPTAVIDPLQDVFHDFAEFQPTNTHANIPNQIEFLKRKKVTLLEGYISGTVRVNYTVGMSGHFIARIKKIL